MSLNCDGMYMTLRCVGVCVYVLMSVVKGLGPGSVQSVSCVLCSLC